MADRAVHRRQRRHLRCAPARRRPDHAAPLQTVPTTAEFYDYTAKRDPRGNRYICPAMVPDAVLAEISRSTLTAH